MHGQISFESLLLTMVAMVCVITLLAGLGAVSRAGGHGNISSVQNRTEAALNQSISPYSYFKIYVG